MFMISLAIIFGLFFTVFAIQNTSASSLTFGETVLTGIPQYAIILGALLLGVLIAWIFNLIDTVSNIFLLRKKENTIRELKKTLGEVVRRVHQLELEQGSPKKDKKPGLRTKTEVESGEDENSL